MSDTSKHLIWSFADLVKARDCRSIEHFVAENRSILEKFALGGLSWVQYAVRFGDLATVEKLESVGFSLHALSKSGDTNALTEAAVRGSPSMFGYLQKQGVQPIVAHSVGNPLFACISASSGDQHSRFGKATDPENYLTIAKMILGEGIETTVRYNMSYGPQINAIMFALIWDREDIAQAIADHVSLGDRVAAKEQIDAAQLETAALSFRGDVTD